jgi:hypothetical protein
MTGSNRGRRAGVGGLRAMRDAQERGEIRPHADLDAAMELLVGSLFARALAGDQGPHPWPERAVETILAGLTPGPHAGVSGSTASGAECPDSAPCTALTFCGGLGLTRRRKGVIYPYPSYLGKWVL